MLKISKKGFLFLSILLLAYVLSRPVLAEESDSNRLKLWWGSYGRVQFSTDFDGGNGQDLDVVSHGSRIEEPPYLELSLYALQKTPGVDFSTVITVGFFNLDEMFHYSGSPNVQLALRNLYAQADNILGSGAFLWVGSRMYRGDDIYLLDYWPLDNLNTIGGGAGWKNKTMEAALHVGVNRLKNSYQFQEITVPGRGFGTETITTLNRQRTIVSAKFEHKFPEVFSKIGLKYKVWSEFEYIPSGKLHRKDDTYEDLPSDSGFAVGLELGTWGFSRNGFLNLFFKYSRDLAAYNELEVPVGIAIDKTTSGAEELLFGFSGNYEYSFFGVLVGGYVRRWLDAIPEPYDQYDRAETMLVMRPMVFLWKYFRAGMEVSWQMRQSPGEEDLIGTSSIPQVVKISIIPALASGQGSLMRPEFRLVYSLAILNEGARFLYPQGDKRRDMSVQHFLGFGVEWWFNAYGY